MTMPTTTDPVIAGLAEVLDEDDLVVEAVTVFAYIRPGDEPGACHYGLLAANGPVMAHCLRGLLESALDQVG